MPGVPARVLLHLLAGLVLTLAAARPAAAASPEEERAAKDTRFDGVHLLAEREQDRLLTALGVHLGYVDKETSLGGGTYRCGGGSRADSISANQALTAAMQYLQEGPLARLRVRYVLLCDGVFDGSQHITGAAVPAYDLVMLDVTASEAQLIHATLHEIYHLLEDRYGGISDAAWRDEFGAGYDNRYPTAGTSTLGGGDPGFISEYGQSFAHEERAELFAYLLIEPDAVAALIRKTGNATLRRKCEFVVDKCRRLAGIELPLRVQ